jgi:hypothetical protein
MFLASLPPGFPQNPNVLLIRTHPNPFPSVGYNSNVWPFSSRPNDSRRKITYRNQLLYLLLPITSFYTYQT